MNHDHIVRAQTRAQELQGIMNQRELTHEEQLEARGIEMILSAEVGRAQDNGAKILDQILEFLERFVSYPNTDSAIAHALWIVHTHLIHSFESTPRLAFLSPEPASGKTRALEITKMLVPNPVEAVNFSAPYLFRKVGDDGQKPTILFDEIDTVFGPKAKDNEEIRGLLNAGHRRGAVAGRCTGTGTIRTEEISAYGAVALAGLGNLPDTILSRSIVIRMRRRAPNESVEPLRSRLHEPEGEELFKRIQAWTESIASRVGELYPELPPEITDRDADVWEPLFAIAEMAGGGWPEKAAVTGVTLVTASKEKPPSTGIQLLSDIRDLFEGKDKISTEELLNLLNSNDELPWGNYRGEPLDARKLGRFLREYLSEHSKTIRISGETKKGYKREWFYEAWKRYLPSKPGDTVTPVTSGTTADQYRAAKDGE